MAKLTTVALLGAAALTTTLGGCAKQGGGAHDPAAIQAAITAAEKGMVDEFKNRDLEGLAGHYTDDAVFASSSGPAANGSTEIRSLFANALSDKNFKLSFASDKIDSAKSGDLAYSRGHFSEQYTDPKSGQVTTENGTYLSVYEKQADGSWKMPADFAVSDPATRKTLPPGKPTTHAKMVSF